MGKVMAAGSQHSWSHSTHNQEAWKGIFHLVQPPGQGKALPTVKVNLHGAMNLLWMTTHRHAQSLASWEILGPVWLTVCITHHPVLLH